VWITIALFRIAFSCLWVGQCGGRLMEHHGIFWRWGRGLSGRLWDTGSYLIGADKSWDFSPLRGIEGSVSSTLSQNVCCVVILGCGSFSL